MTEHRLEFMGCCALGVRGGKQENHKDKTRQQWVPNPLLRPFPNFLEMKMAIFLVIPY